MSNFGHDVSASDLRNAARIARQVGMPISADGLAQFAAEAEMHDHLVKVSEVMDDRDKWRAQAKQSEAAIARINKELEDWYDDGTVPVKFVRAAIKEEP